ncbi:MAG: hypothetical protein JWR05_202 [Mucilaginibacter sp.]|nr:hypothetical protein [Mucilaginibacter sp.]
MSSDFNVRMNSIIRPKIIKNEIVTKTIVIVFNK